MPSWNIHTAHAEHLLERHRAGELGIADENAFLFGNYVPDIYVGFMVPDASFHIDYCITHAAAVNRIPLPDADYFWDRYVGRRFPKTPAGQSLTLGAWAHLVADRFYNGNFRQFCASHEVPEGDALRTSKQSDFDMFGRTLKATREVRVTPELIEAARTFVPYCITREDVASAADVANAIVGDGAVSAGDAAPPAGTAAYRLVSPDWLAGVFDACDERLAVWLRAWQQLVREDAPHMAADVRERAGLAPQGVGDAIVL